MFGKENPKMDLKKVFSLMDKAEKSSFNKIEIELEDLKIRLDRSAATAPSVPFAVQNETEQQSSIKQAGRKEDYILAPISGIFYAAKAPGEPAFVTVGDRVKKGRTVCIIEAMKTMNEISAPKSGVIESIMIGDTEQVKADQPLFRYAEE